MVSEKENGIQTSCTLLKTIDLVPHPAFGRVDR